MEVDQHFIKEKIGSGVIYVVFVLIGQQVVDVLTKGISRHKFDELTSKMGMWNLHAPT